jgi:hypothetical protein
MSFVGGLLLLKAVFAIAQAIAVFTKTKYAAYILFILSSLPPFFVYLYDERKKFKDALRLKRFRLILYLLSWVFILLPFGYPFRFLAVAIYTYKLTWKYAVFLFSVVLTLCMLGGFNQLQGVLLTYGLGLAFSFIYQYVFARDSLDYILFFCECFVFWSVQIPLFYTRNHYIWVFFVSSLYGVLHLFLTEERFNKNNNDKKNDDEFTDMEIIFCNDYWRSLILFCFATVTGFLTYIGILYGMSIEQYLPYSLF